ncbi:MAG: CrcB family protein [Actinobacteria bacterium]|nr:CrcB family protein [Actinomycetota bacterium]
MEYLLVALGAAIGSFGRYQIGAWIQGLAGDPNFPLGTFLVNISGAFLIGLGFGISERAYLFSGAWSFLAVGTFGGYTTFSTFTLETLDLFTRGNYRGVLLNLLSGPIGLIAIAVGVVLIEGLRGLRFAA